MTEERVAIRPGDAARIELLGMTHSVPSALLDGSLSILEGVIRPGSLIPPHTHSREDECTYVLEGNLVFDVGGRLETVGPGSFVVKPRGTYHAFWNASEQAARVLEIHAPGAFDAFYDELAGLLADESLGDDERAGRILALNSRYGLVHHVERIPEYVQRYGVRP